MSFETVFSNGGDLPELPEVVQALIADLHNQSVEPDKIARAVHKDAQLAARVLTLVNSTRLTSEPNVATIESAIELLGCDALQTLIIASGVSGAFARVPSINSRVFWRQSIAVALVAQELASGTPEANLAFLLGFMHQLGQLVLNLAYPEQAANNAKLELAGSARQTLDPITFDFDEIEISAELARRWNFPDSFVWAVSQHAQPLSGTGSKRQALLLHLAINVEDFLMQKTTDENELVAGLSDIWSPLALDLPAHLANLTELIDDSSALECALREGLTDRPMPGNASE